MQDIERDNFRLEKINLFQIGKIPTNKMEFRLILKQIAEFEDNFLVHTLERHNLRRNINILHKWVNRLDLDACNFFTKHENLAHCFGIRLPKCINDCKLASFATTNVLVELVGGTWSEEYVSYKQCIKRTQDKLFEETTLVHEEVVKATREAQAHVEAANKRYKTHMQTAEWEFSHALKATDFFKKEVEEDS